MKLIFEYEESITGHLPDCSDDDSHSLGDLPRELNSKRTPFTECERN